MQFIIITVISWLALAVSVGAQTMQVPVTPHQLEYSNFVFAVSSTSTTNGAAFHVIITTKTEPIQDDCIASLTVINATGTLKMPPIQGVKPPVEVAVDKTDRVWKADFNAPNELIGDPSVFFIFVVSDYLTNADGTKTYLPSDRIYEIRLQDFVKH